VLDDGTYDALVVDVDDLGDALRLTLTIIAGEHKGEIVDVRASGFDTDALDLMGMPATLHVRDGAPHLSIDD
jgi:hypothetical protein